MEVESDEINDCTPPEIVEAAKITSLKLLPEKSKRRYEYAYDQFLRWRRGKEIRSSFSENVLLVYFDELSLKVASSTLWTQYSMLHSTLYVNHNVDISKYLKLKAFLKRKADGYKPKKAKTLTAEEVNEFITTAPDEKFLFTKVALIMGISGACRKQELIQLTVDDIDDIGSAAVVKVVNTKNKIQRSFTITGQFYNVFKKYSNLRPETTQRRFFLNYQNGTCTNQVVGINKMGCVPKIVATFLNLKNAELYTGHSFRRSSATILVDAGANLTTLKRHGGWKSSTVAEGYIDDSAANRLNIANKIMGAVEGKSRELSQAPSTELWENTSAENSIVQPSEQPSTSQSTYTVTNSVNNNQNIQELLENTVTNSHTPLHFTDLQSSTENVIVVCKSMFMNTLGLRSDSIITDYLKRTPNDLPINLKDKRGQKRAEAVKVIADKNYAAVKKHIDSYHPQVSHYNLEHAPNKRYLPCDITIREMYKDFLSKFNKISYETYRKIFDKENIGFASPTQDECGMCSTYKNHVHENNMPTTSTSTDHGLEDEEARLEELGKAICDICKKYDVHKTRYTVARKQYNEDSNKKWTNDFEIYSVDMQKVLILPKMTIKNSFFVSRLVAFHETFANLQAAHENKCVLWHEAIRGRNGPDVVSAFYNVLKRLSNETKHVIFWTDNCTAQNKNWTLFTACVLFVNEEWGPESITFKYFEPGHSFMKADSVHGLIGKKWKHTPEVLDYEDLVHLIESSNKLNKVINLRVEDFLEFENACQTRKKGTDLPKLNEIKCVQFVKGSKKLFFKHELEHESFSEVSFLKPKLKLVLPKQITVERGINQKKKDTIIKELTQYMPPRKQIFWKNLPSREDVEDLGISTAHS